MQAGAKSDKKTAYSEIKSRIATDILRCASVSKKGNADLVRVVPSSISKDDPSRSPNVSPNKGKPEDSNVIAPNKSEGNALQVSEMENSYADGNLRRREATGSQ